ncbi:MFS general substrate transporter [Daedaleopsis nitida]|nr:MFS general substrate transporter [Daedaleopsis nitida]
MLTWIAIAAISTSGTVAPRVEIYTRTICHTYNPEMSPAACRTDDTVQASAAQLMAIMSSVTGLMSTVTAAWWGSLSDCYGRIWVLACGVAGLMLADFCFLGVAHLWESLPGTYWWFALGAVFEGITGGISVASSTMHAYISDCTDPTTRLRAFSQLMGLLFVGMSVGPLLSGYIMRTTGELLPVFYITTAIDAAVSLTVWFVLPESMPSAEMQRHRAARSQRLAALGGGALGWAKRVGSTFDVVSPLSVLLPRKVERQGRKSVLDWSMPILGLAYGFGVLIQAAIYQQIQYASAVFGWSSDVVSYWLGAMHTAKAVYLTVLFPALIKFLTVVWSRRQRAPEPDESRPLLEDDREHARLEPRSIQRKGAPIASMDLWLARGAMLTDLVFYALTFATRSGALYAVYTSCISFGTHFGPTVQSLALDIYARHGGTDTGRLLGALTVVSALSSHIVGPALFGLIYMKTVGTVPGAFYLLQCAAVFTSFLLLMEVHRDVPLLRADARSRSRPGSRPHTSRNSTNNSILSIGYAPEDIINPAAAQINEEDAELLQDLVNPHFHPQHHHAVEDTLVDGDGDGDEGTGELEGQEPFDDDWREKLPWWRRPSPLWSVPRVCPFRAIAMTITAAAKVELFTYLACQAHRPTVNPDGQGAGALLARMAGGVVSAYAGPSQRECAHDPVVQAAVAKLSVIMTTTMGVLSCMTTAWWGSMSDRYGRTRVLGCAVVGVLTMDLCFLSVFWFYRYIPGGYWFLVLGPLVEGFLGGQALIGGTIHAYMSDCTPPAGRSGIFSLQLGLMFVGVGIGPTLGGVVIRLTQNFINVFYISAALHTIYAFLVWFVIPESLSRAEMLDARARYKTDVDEYRSAHAHGGLLVFFKRMFAFLTPLGVFLPVDLNGGNPTKGKKRDWSLLFLITSHGFVQSLLGLYVYIIQYLTGTYGWTTEEVSYWFSSVGAARAIFLTLIFPVIVSYFKPKSPIQLPTEPEEPLNSPTELRARSPPPHARSPGRHAPHSPQFDLRIARYSLGVEIVVYTLLVCSTSGLMFAGLSTFGALGMGFGPAVQSVALTLYNRRGGKDSGKLFGAMSVVQAMSSQVFGPFVYGLTYARTVGTFPKTIFVVAVCAVVLAFVLLLLVRIPKEDPQRDVEEHGQGQGARVEREDTLVEVPGPLIVVEDEDRGRKVVKP